MQIVSLKLFKYHFVFWLNFNKFADKEAWAWTWKADRESLKHIYSLLDSWEEKGKLKRKKEHDLLLEIINFALNWDYLNIMENIHIKHQFEFNIYACTIECTALPKLKLKPAFEEAGTGFDKKCFTHAMLFSVKSFWFVRVAPHMFVIWKGQTKCVWE